MPGRSVPIMRGRRIHEKMTETYAKVLFSTFCAWAHTVGITMAFLTDYGWISFQRFPYSTDLALSDYYLFPQPKPWFRTRTFVNDEDCKLEWTHYLKMWTKVSMLVVLNCLYIGTINALTVTAAMLKNKEFSRVLTCVDSFFPVLPGGDKKIPAMTFETPSY